MKQKASERYLAIGSSGLRELSLFINIILVIPPPPLGNPVLGKMTQEMRREALSSGILN